MINYALVLFSLLIPIYTPAETVTSKVVASAPKASTNIKLPKCIDEPSVVKSIESTVVLNSKKSFKYNRYKQALASDSSEQLLARLIYAETKAANCKEFSDVVSTLVSTVILNRVKIRKGDVRSVIFQRNQFASSLSIYSESQYKEFLCPSDSGLWQTALTKATVGLNDKTQPTNTVNYFLYKHSPAWTKEPWDLKEDTSVGAANARVCIKAFRDPDFK